jgi:hypothetical protein
MKKLIIFTASCFILVSSLTVVCHADGLDDAYTNERIKSSQEHRESDAALTREMVKDHQQSRALEIQDRIDANKEKQRVYEQENKARQVEVDAATLRQIEADRNRALKDASNESEVHMAEMREDMAKRALDNEKVNRETREYYAKWREHMEAEEKYWNAQNKSTKN